MVGFARWCIAHRRWVIVGWIVVAIGSTVIAAAVGRQYSTNFSLPGTEAQHVTDLLQSEFKSQSGDVDTIVFHTANGTVDDPQVRARDRAGCWPRWPTCLTSSAWSARTRPPARSRSHTTGRRRSRRSTTTSARTSCPTRPESRCSPPSKRWRSPALKIAAGGQVIEQAEGFSIGPATSVGVLAALVILLLTFGSLYAAGMPLITAGLGLDHRHRARRTGHAHHRHVERLTRAGDHDRARGGGRLRAVHRHPFPRELPQERRRRAVGRAGDGYVGPSDSARGDDRRSSPCWECSPPA